jgi:hypothetical protein
MSNRNSTMRQQHRSDITEPCSVWAGITFPCPRAKIGQDILILKENPLLPCLQAKFPHRGEQSIEREAHHATTECSHRDG